MFKRKKSDSLGGTGSAERKSPLRAHEQEAPQPERPADSERDRQDDVEQRHPSQAEGER